MDLEKLSATVFSSSLPQALIDSHALRQNLLWLQKTVAPAKMFMVLKGNAHGHGTIESAKIAQSIGLHDFAVLMPNEALQIRQIEPMGRIFVWQFTPQSDLREIIAHNLEIGLGTKEQLYQTAYWAKKQRQAAAVHLKLDTGLSRGGTRADTWPQLLSLAEKLQEEGLIKLSGFWSHLPNASLEDDRKSLRIFIENTSHQDSITRHIAASIAAIRMPESRLDYTRIGLACFGYCDYTDQLKTVMTLIAPVLRLLSGSNLSEPPRAIIACGYTHGLSPLAAGKLEVTLNGWRCRILEVGPESTIIEMPLSAKDPVHMTAMPRSLAEHAIIFGAGNFGELNASEWAKKCQTTPDDILSSVKAERVYLD